MQSRAHLRPPVFDHTSSCFLLFCRSESSRDSQMADTNALGNVGLQPALSFLEQLHSRHTSSSLSKECGIQVARPCCGVKRIVHTTCISFCDACLNSLPRPFAFYTASLPCPELLPMQMLAQIHCPSVIYTVRERSTLTLLPSISPPPPSLSATSRHWPSAHQRPFSLSPDP